MCVERVTVVTSTKTAGAIKINVAAATESAAKSTPKQVSQPKSKKASGNKTENASSATQATSQPIKVQPASTDDNENPWLTSSSAALGMVACSCFGINVTVMFFTTEVSTPLAEITDKSTKAEKAMAQLQRKNKLERNGATVSSIKVDVGVVGFV